MPAPPALARFNKAVTNRLTSRVAGRLPGFGIITHRGRRSGREYHTPVNAFRRGDGFAFALTYGQGDWVKNVLAAGGADMTSRRHTYHLTNPRLVRDPAHREFPSFVRMVLNRLHADEVLEMDEA